MLLLNLISYSFEFRHFLMNVKKTTVDDIQYLKHNEWKNTWASYLSKIIILHRPGKLG